MSNIDNNGLNYSSVAAVTPSDSVTHSHIYGFMVGVAGDVAVKSQSMGSAVTIVGCIAGIIYPIGGRDFLIMSANTTATSIVALV